MTDEQTIRRLANAAIDAIEDDPAPADLKMRALQLAVVTIGQMHRVSPSVMIVPPKLTK